jgi:hypothetical protein
VSFGEVALWFLRLPLLIGLFGRLEHLICETLQSVIVSGLVLSLGVENSNPMQEAFEFTRHGPVLLVASRPLYVVHRVIHLPLLVVALEKARLIQVARLLLLLLLSGVEGHLLSQGILVGNCQHLFRHPGVLHGKLVDQG